LLLSARLLFEWPKSGERPEVGGPGMPRFWGLGNVRDRFVDSLRPLTTKTVVSDRRLRRDERVDADGIPAEARADVGVARADGRPRGVGPHDQVDRVGRGEHQGTGDRQHLVRPVQLVVAAEGHEELAQLHADAAYAVVLEVDLVELGAALLRGRDVPFEAHRDSVQHRTLAAEVKVGEVDLVLDLRLEAGLPGPDVAPVQREAAEHAQLAEPLEQQFPALVRRIGGRRGGRPGRRGETKRRHEGDLTRFGR
jgi:hypothetical protein